MITYSVAPYPLTSPRIRRRIAEGGKDRIPERLLAQLWKERAARQTGLRTEAGKRVRVVYPGRPGTAAGPDFRDALLEVEGLGLVSGDVELHIKQSDWNSHGYGRDPNYNGVVVHGALEVHSKATRLQSGSLAPVVDLKALLTESPAIGSAKEPLIDLWQVLALKGFPRPASVGEAGETLDRAGDHRFLFKSRWLSECIRADGPDQALYQALMEGLGYSSNRRPFVELASRAPYRALAQAAWRLAPEERFEVIRGWLGACSGLDSPDPRPPRGMGPPMNKGEWRLFRVRPVNQPRRRIMGAAVLLDRFLVAGLPVGLGEVVEDLSPAKLTGSLCAAGVGGPAYVGRSRALDLEVNAVLPFMHAWGEVSRQGPGPEVAATLYRRFPMLTGNEITREMTAQLLPVQWHVSVANARRQYGLLHLAALLKGAHGQSPA
jgi:hypothetical protein